MKQYYRPATPYERLLSSDPNDGCGNGAPRSPVDSCSAPRRRIVRAQRIYGYGPRMAGASVHGARSCAVLPRCCGLPPQGLHSFPMNSLESYGRSQLASPPQHGDTTMINGSSNWSGFPTMEQFMKFSRMQCLMDPVFRSRSLSSVAAPRARPALAHGSHGLLYFEWRRPLAGSS